jgi:hypothetical protein
VIRLPAQAEALLRGGEDKDRFHHGEPVTDADARTAAERHVGEARQPARQIAGPALRPKLFGIREVARIVMQDASSRACWRRTLSLPSNTSVFRTVRKVWSAQKPASVTLVRRAVIIFVTPGTIATLTAPAISSDRFKLVWRAALAVTLAASRATAGLRAGAYFAFGPAHEPRDIGAVHDP